MLLKERWKVMKTGREDDEEDASRYRMTLRKGVDSEA